MTVADALAAARTAQSARADRPATAIVHDAPDARLVVFRIEPGQEVAPHTSTSAVTLVVLAGRGTVSGGDGEAAAGPGTVVAYAPGELHGMRAAPDAGAADAPDGAVGPFVLLATITPRPGSGAPVTPVAPTARATVI